MVRRDHKVSQPLLGQEGLKQVEFDLNLDSSNTMSPVRTKLFPWDMDTLTYREVGRPVRFSSLKGGEVPSSRVWSPHPEELILTGRPTSP